MNDADEPFTLPSAWEQLRVLLGYMAALFGAPAALAERMFLRAATRFEILQWLAPLEAVARRLLAIEALGRAPPNAPPPAARVRDARVRSALKDQPFTGEPGAPETWRVVFNLWPGARVGWRAGMQISACAEPQGEPPLLRNALALARRIEALRRLTEQPKNALRRMGRLIAARRGSVRARFTAYAPRGRLRVCPAATLLDSAQAQLCVLLADTS